MLAPRPFLSAVPRPAFLPRDVQMRASDGPCDQAILAAERRHGIPPGLLAAMGQVESGRPDGQGVRRPWPWTINVEGAGAFFPSQAQAVAGVRQAQVLGRLSIDVGCLQVNLRHHPGAFATLEEAFDPAANADYAARYLVSLRPLAGGNWLEAVGMYHSMTPDRAQAYRGRVQRALGYAPSLPLPVVLATAAPALAARTLLTPAELRQQARRESDPLSSMHAVSIAAALDGFVRSERVRLAAVARRRARQLDQVEEAARAAAGQAGMAQAAGESALGAPAN